MTTLAVYLNEPNEAAWKTIQSEWPDRHFILDERLAFIAPEGLALTSDVAKKIGLGENDSTLGVVMEIESHAGFNRSPLWEWLSKAS